MSEVVSVEAVLDGALDAAVRADWAALAAAGMSSLAPHTAPSNRPHVTFLVRPSLRAINPALRRALLERLPLPVTLGEPILFGEGDRRVLVRPVSLTPALDELHRTLHRGLGRRLGRGEEGNGKEEENGEIGEFGEEEEFGEAGEADVDAPHTIPGEWTPHVTLARRLRLADVPAAREVVTGELTGQIVALRRWDAASQTITELS